jgi:RNA polymerase-binding protein DksA
VKATAKKTAPAKKAAPVKTAAKKTAPAKKAGPVKATAKKAAPAKKATPVKATAKKTTPAKKAAASPSRAASRKAATSASSFPVLPGEKPWTKAEIDEVIADLNDDRARVVRTLTAQEEDLAGLMRDAGDGAGHDQADMGATSFERDQELIVLNNEREKLAQIDRALARIADGTYGICESCGNPIGKGRAMAFPRATLCLTCKQREERR